MDNACNEIAQIDTEHSTCELKASGWVNIFG